MKGRHVPWGPCLGILLLACTLAQNASNDSSPGDSKDKNSTNSTNSSDGKPKKTGNPQIDYLLDPNLPRELNGFSLANYPFYSRIPQGIDFKCDGLHDGFYASVLHKCQVYHHCLFGVRYDFLCANYTAFDQKNFICHFVSEVDCINSPKYFIRNEMLYKEAEPPTTKPPPPVQRDRYPERTRGGNRRRRPVRPRPEYYDDYYEDEYLDFYDYEVPDNAPPVQKNKKQRGQASTSSPAEEDISQHDTSSSGASRPIAPSRESLFVRQRAPPKIRPPVPLSERERYDRIQGRMPGKEEDKQGNRASKPKTRTTQAPQLDYDDQYSDDVLEKEVSKPKEIAPASTAGGRKPSHTERPKQIQMYDDEEPEELPRDSKPLATDDDSGHPRSRRPPQKVPTSNRGYGNRRRFGQPSEREEQHLAKTEEPREATNPPPRVSPRPSQSRGRPSRPRSSSTETPISNEAVEEDDTLYHTAPSGRGETPGRPHRARGRPHQKHPPRYQDPQPDEEEDQEEPLRLRPGYGNRGQPSRYQPQDEDEDDLEQQDRTREAHPRRQTQGEGQFRLGGGGGRRRLRPLASRPLPRRRARPRIPDYDYEY